MTGAKRGRKPKAVIHTDDFSPAQVTIGEIGDGVETTKDDIEIVQPSQLADKAAEEKFMNEFVVIMIEPDDDPNSPEFLYSGHNGISQYIHRGHEQRIRRKFLYSLVSGKKVQFSCSFGKRETGEPFNRMVGSGNTTYRLSVIEDTQEGRKRFVKWMKETAMPTHI